MRLITFQYCSESNHYFDIDVEFNIYSENDYGADRDGNRGIYAEWIEDGKILYIENQNGIEINPACLSDDYNDKIIEEAKEKLYF